MASRQAPDLEDAHFESADGTQLHGIFMDHPNPVAVALWMHGNAGNVSHRIDSLRLLNQRHRLAVLVFDYRGYGRSEGDGIPTQLLKEAATELAPSLAKLLNKSFQTGTTPQEWRDATITPIYKQKGKKSDPSNYRPISLLPIISKV
ncbi:MAG: hypothetical protein AAF483_17705, partial [Planctomycetota bacterium]